MTYGPHFTADAKGCKPGTLSDLSLIYRFMDELPELIGMQVLTRPYIVDYKDPNPLESGITCVTTITQSHLTIHTYPQKDYFFFDVFSCQPFDTDKVVEFIKEFFDPQELDINVVERGKNFPR